MLKIFFDLDGTLAKFNSKKNALERFDKEKGFFANLKPYKHIEVINELATRQDIQVFIISATPNKQADKDKMIWIKKYLNQINEKNICFCRLNVNKAKAIKEQLNIDIDNKCILLDDYSKNLFEWNKSNGIGIKRLTSKADNSRGLWKGYCLKDLRQLSSLLDTIAMC